MLTITEYTDPGCPFAFSFEPIRRKLLWTYGHGLEWRHRMIVLSRSPEDYERKGFTTERMSAGLRDIQRRWGMPIDPRLRPRMAATEPACRAVVATRLHAPACEDRLLRRLRVLAMAGELLDDDATLVRAAREAGIDPQQLRRWIADPAVDLELRRDARAARGPSEPALALEHRLAPTEDGMRYTAPSIVVENDDDGRIDIPGLNPLETYEIAIANLAPELERRDAPSSAEEALRWAGEPLATAEVAMLVEVDHDEARTQLARFAREEPVGPDGYWELERAERRAAA